MNITFPRIRIATKQRTCTFSITQSRDCPGFSRDFVHLFFLFSGKTPPYMGKRGRFVIFAVLCLPSRWGHCSQILVLLAFVAHNKGCDGDTFRAVFLSIWVSWEPQTLQNKGKRKMTNRPRFTLAWPSLQSLAVNYSLFFCKFWVVKNF